MPRINYLVKKYPDLFKYLPAAEVHIHDHFVDKILLKYIPQHITPNRITLLRVILTPIVFLLILFNHYQLGIKSSAYFLDEFSK